MNIPSEPRSLFLRACLGLDVPQTPVWLMRQAGRYLPEYREVRRQAGSFLALCKNPELATQVTLQPINRFGLDAAILFSDILVVPEAMGMELHFLDGEGPHLPHPLIRPGDLDRLREPDPGKDLGYVLAAIDLLVKHLPDPIPLIGFSGSPWTLATYMIEGGSSKKFARIKTMLYDDPRLLDQLLQRLVHAVTDYLNAQIDHGVKAVQIFDTWGGVLGPEAYRRFSLEPMARIIAGLKRHDATGAQVPVIVFSKGCGGYLEMIATSGCDVVGLDWTTPLDQARTRLGAKVALQGNLDPAVLNAAPQRIRMEVIKVLESMGNRNGHVFNLGHGMEPGIDPEKVPVLIAAVREESRRIRHRSEKTTN
ncbi:MAG: uroporphyrinogen decarboxylase [Magnetococcales bacterium]|nr:uroporphyrinogen decarboxylase [Magnetococcales bacterium]